MIILCQTIPRNWRRNIVDVNPASTSGTGHRGGNFTRLGRFLLDGLLRLFRNLFNPLALFRNLFNPFALLPVPRFLSLPSPLQRN